MSELYKYFSHGELASKDDGTVRLDPRFEKALIELRKTYGKPMWVNSCCRTPSHNKRIGGASSSYHLTEHAGRDGTMAIDIAISGGSHRKDVVELALKLGWSIGVYRTFVHLDRRADIGKEQIVFYGS